MKHFIETVGEIKKNVSANATQVIVEETLDLYNEKFQMAYVHIKQLIDAYGERAFSNYLIGMIVQDPKQDRPLLYDDFINLAFFYEQNPTYILSVELKINKETAFDLNENEYMFFGMNEFYRYFNYHNPQLFEHTSKRKVITVFLPIQSEIKNDFIQLLPHKQPVINLDIPSEVFEEYQRIIKSREESCRIHSYFPIPETFLTMNLVDTELQNWFNKNLFCVSLSHIGNKMISSNAVVIRGSKNVEIALSEEFVGDNATNIYNIYKFAYEEKHQSDKIEIARNVITIYLNTADNINHLNKLGPTIEKTIKSHFTAYVQDSIKKFFNDRKDVIKESHKFATDIKSEADKLMTYINASFLGIVTAVFAGSLGLSKGERWFLLLAFGLHALAFLLTYLFNRIFINKKLMDIQETYDEYTSKFVFLETDELSDIKKIYILKSVNNVKRYLRTYMFVTIFLILFMIALIWVGIELPDSYFK